MEMWHERSEVNHAAESFAIVSASRRGLDALWTNHYRRRRGDVAAMLVRREADSCRSYLRWWDAHTKGKKALEVAEAKLQVGESLFTTSRFATTYEAKRFTNPCRMRSTPHSLCRMLPGRTARRAVRRWMVCTFLPPHHPTLLEDLGEARAESGGGGSDCEGECRGGDKAALVGSLEVHDGRGEGSPPRRDGQAGG